MLKRLKKVSLYVNKSLILVVYDLSLRGLIPKIEQKPSFDEA